MSALAQANDHQEQAQSVTTISANARVDYILRFSKQAVLVIDDQLEGCSDIGSQFLANLPNGHNAAFISVSAKLNDIQVRCRLVEQLFGGDLFDPEHSIAVSIVNLAKQQRQPIDIVVENAHFLSLQLIHELCQLAEIAKKIDLSINVLMLGSIDAGRMISENRVLFNKKLSILSAQTGQLLLIDSKLFRPSASLFQLTKKKVWLSVSIGLSLLAIATVLMLFQKDVFSLSQISAPKQAKPANEVIINTDDETFALQKLPTTLEPLDKTTANVQADINDIYAALTNSPEDSELVIEEAPEIAMAADIFSALDSSNSVKEPELTSDAALVETAVITTKPKEIATEQQSISHVKPEYYLSARQGYIIQMAGFAEKSRFEEFLTQFPLMDYYAYLKKLNDTQILVVTSRIYQTRREAEEKLASIAGSLGAVRPWIKSVAAVNNEINAFQRSQSNTNQVTIPAS